jgi:Flp pilus assembly protein TadD
MSPRPLLAALALLLAPSLIAGPMELPRANEKWITLRADEFEFISNASPAQTLDIARDLLRMRAAIGQVTRLKVRSSLPTKVLIFASDRSFGPYRDAVLQRKTENVIGVFAKAEIGNFILMRSDTEVVDRTVYHELTHHFVENTLTGLPLWFGEGIAEYYSTFGTTGTAVNIGRPVAEHVLWLRGQSLIPLSELFATRSDSPTYNEGTRQGVFYAESWALFHYLMADADRRVQLGRFLSLLGEGKSVDDAFTGAFAMKYAQLEQELRNYVRHRTFTYSKYNLTDVAIQEPPKPEPMTRDAVLYQLGHLLAWTGPENAATAEAFLNEALTANAGNASAHADRGRLLDSTGRRSEADAAYQRAIQLGSADAEVYLFAAASLLERFTDREMATVPREEVERVRDLFRRSAELDPSSARAWAGIGATYVGSAGDLAPGIAALEKSLAMAPGNEEAAFNLAQLYAYSGRGDDAARLFNTTLARSSDPEVVRRSREVLLFAEVRRVEALARGDRSQEALVLARSVLERATEPSLREHLAGFIAELERYEASNKIIAALNDATAKANAGQHAEALAILDAAIPSITDPAMLAEAQKFRADLAARMKKKK